MNTTGAITVVKQRPFKRHYDFFLDDGAIASLDYPRSYGRTAMASIGNRQWRLTRRGFWKQAMEIVAEQSPYTRQTVNFNWRYRVSLHGEDGREYSLRQANCFRQKWVWTDESGTPVLEIKSNMFSHKRRGVVQLLRPYSASLAWMVLVGWFVIVAQEDATAVVAVT